jgi:hypothetical protein
MAPAFSILQPGIVSDIVRFGPDTVRPLPHADVPDFPIAAMWLREPRRSRIRWSGKKCSKQEAER